MSRLTQLLIIAHAGDAEVQAKAVAKQMRALGYEVERETSGPVTRPRASINDRLAHAGRVVVLWSPDATRAPWLNSAARRAGKMGKLTILPTASLPAPAALRRSSIELPRRRRNGTGNAQTRSAPSRSGFSPAPPRTSIQSTIQRGRTVMNASTQPYRQSASGDAPRSSASRTTRISAIFLLLVMVLITGGAAYQIDAGFAARVNALTGGASAQASELIGSFSH